VSDISEHREFLSDDSAVFVASDDVTSLSNAIVAVLESPEESRRRTQVASHQVKELTVQSAADAYEKVYRTVINEGAK